MLGPEQIEKLKLVLYSSGWKEVMKPLLEQRLLTVRKLANLLPTERPEPYSKIEDHTATSVLRGEGKALEWVIAAFQNEVIVADANRKQEELDGKPDEGVPANPV